MIINLRGTHGSGKTTLVRKVMAQFRKCRPVFIEGRRHPIGYVCDKRVFVVGHYEGDASGGCDTVPKVDLMFDMIRKYADRGYHVLFEGILAQHSATRILELRDEGYRVRIVQLNIPIKRAIRSVKDRRRRRGNAKPLDPTNVIREARTITTSARRLRDEGIRLSKHTTRKSARVRLFQLLEIP